MAGAGSNSEYKLGESEISRDWFGNLDPPGESSD